MNPIDRARYAPFLAQLVVTRRCNLRCTYCDEYDAHSPPVPFDMLADRLAHLKRLGTFAVELTGGEPLLNPNATDVVQEATRLGFWRRMLITNATLLTPDTIEGLNQAGLTDMQVSLDGVNPTRTTSKVLRLRRPELMVLGKHARFRVTLSAVLGSAPPDEVIEIVRFAREQGFRPRVLIQHDSSGQSSLNGDEADALGKALADLGIPGTRDLRKRLSLAPVPFKCRAGARYLYVNEHGSVQWCSRTANLFSRALSDYTLEDLREQFLQRKPCTKRCTLGCVRSTSYPDEWRPQGT